MPRLLSRLRRGRCRRARRSPGSSVLDRCRRQKAGNARLRVFEHVRATTPVPRRCSALLTPHCDLSSPAVATPAETPPAPSDEPASPPPGSISSTSPTSASRSRYRDTSWGRRPARSHHRRVWRLKARPRQRAVGPCRQGLRLVRQPAKELCDGDQPAVLRRVPEPAAGPDRLGEALRSIGRDDVAVTYERIETPEQAEQARFPGSPTILVDGRAPLPTSSHGWGCPVGSSEPRRAHKARRPSLNWSASSAHE